MSRVFELLTANDLAQVLHVEQRAYSHPWSMQNFQDSLASGYRLQGLWQGQQLLAYSVCMPGVDELHLLNFTVNPSHQGQGVARMLMGDVCAAAHARRFEWIWLEVRQSNARAIAVYERLGFARVGQRRGYYPMSHTQREDAIVMSLEVAKSQFAIALEASA
jgi:[ribosomal protein S18]-alanine N-acetyltransferase